MTATPTRRTVPVPAQQGASCVPPTGASAGGGADRQYEYANAGPDCFWPARAVRRPPTTRSAATTTSTTHHREDAR